MEIGCDARTPATQAIATITEKMGHMNENTAATPTTDDVRRNFAFGVHAAIQNPTVAGNIDWPEPGARDAQKAAFDRWLADHDHTVTTHAFDRIRALLPVWVAERPRTDEHREADAALYAILDALDTGNKQQGD
ncbi:hypothetical protein [Microbacterium telephonicum]|uniref:Uncharacterized protein n=1 Tax=Microbacterium telephonicum TaxID=1714841 RepID=A0A498BZA9_9MICO|nr:hypothetical protein [Microbacterium telephonicum]RLK47656.1 hypothetical protein C7474_2252 [Microbacterium telephonicum]